MGSVPLYLLHTISGWLSLNVGAKKVNRHGISRAHAIFEEASMANSRFIYLFIFFFYIYISSSGSYCSLCFKTVDSSF